MELQLSNKEKHRPRALFRVIVVMFLPFFISFSILDTKNHILPLVAFAYIIQSIIIAKTFFKKRVKISIIFMTICLIIIQLLTIISDSVAGININGNDFINVLAKALNFFLFFGIMINVKLNKNQILFFMKCLVVFAFIGSAYNMIINWDIIANLQHITSSYQVELKSFFPNRNQFGMFLFISIIAHHYIITSSAANKKSIFVLLIQILNLVLTMSRGSILALIVFYGILYIKHFKNIKILASIMLMLSTMILLIISNEQLKDFIIKNIIRADVGIAGRNDVWNMGFDVFIQNNIINGVGFYTGVEIAKSKGFQFDQFHSFYIDTLVSGGLLELLFIISILVYVYRRCLKNCGEKEFKRIYVASMGGVFATSFFESVSLFSIGYVDTIFTIFFITIPILLSNMERISEATNSTKKEAKANFRQLNNLDFV